MALAANSVEGKAAPYIERIENLHKQLESLRGKYMADCRPLREDIAEIFSEAKEKGVAPKPLRQLVKYRQLERQQNSLPEKLDIDERAVFEQLVDALGDLGRAAAKSAGYPAKEEPPKTERADADALSKVGKGASDAVDSLATR